MKEDAVIVMDEIDIWRSANLLIKQHGERAAVVAADQVVQFQRAGDGDGMTVWVGIMMAIYDLTNGGSKGNAPSAH